MDGSGNIYIADAGNHRIRKVDADGNISTVAGSGTMGYGGDGGSATAAATKLNFPYDVALDGSGNLYIADFNNYRIRRVDADGNIATFAGNGLPGCCRDGQLATTAWLGRPQSVALDGSNNLYSASYNAHRIRKVTAGHEDHYHDRGNRHDRLRRGRRPSGRGAVGLPPRRGCGRVGQPLLCRGIQPAYSPGRRRHGDHCHGRGRSTQRRRSGNRGAFELPPRRRDGRGGQLLCCRYSQLPHSQDRRRGEHFHVRGNREERI